MAAYQWIISSLLGLDESRGYRAPSKLADSLTEIWARKGEADAWEIVGRVFDLSWKLIRSNNYGETMEENSEPGCGDWTPDKQGFDRFV